MGALVVIRDTGLKDLLVYWEQKRRGRPMPLAGELSLVESVLHATGTREMSRLGGRWDP